MPQHAVPLPPPQQYTRIDYHAPKQQQNPQHLHVPSPHNPPQAVELEVEGEKVEAAVAAPEALRPPLLLPT